MPNLSQKFIDGPEAFLKQYVVKVADPPGKEAVVTGEFDFIQQIEGVDSVNLVKAEGGLVKAHFLRWITKEVTYMTLAAGPKYFFTSQMTNCSFAVFGDPKTPTVYHTAWTIESLSEKRGKERKINPNPKAERRLSASAGRRGVHNYSGQDGSPASSAFVYGVCQEDGTWAFSAQVVAGNVEKYVPKTGTLPKILDPFMFKPWYD